MPKAMLFRVSLSYADFERAQITGSDFGGSFLQNARFDKARVERSLFRSVIGKTGKGPFDTDVINMPSMLAGISFEDAFLRDIDFTQARASLASFDAATLHNVVFTDTTLAGATFRGAVLLNVGFEGAALNSVDFDDAIVGRGDFLDRLEQEAVAGTFKRARFTIREVSIDKLLRVDSAFATLEATEVAEIVGGQTVWQITRVGDFEQP
ncbi:MAG: pentapeptide repeat-containing protein [Rhodobacterales bacterium]|nr:pentapeptide repeat-containing protein [Rhodobacterales bacterium]